MPSTATTGYKEILSQLIGCPSVSSETNLPLIEYAEDFLKSLGFTAQRFYNDEGNKANLIARIGPEKPGGIMLAGHSDVVPVQGQKWDSDPFELVEKDGRLIGRGTSDMKGFLALAMAAAAELNKEALEYPLYLVFTYDEEVGCWGAKALLNHLENLSDRPQYVLIGEPTDMKLVTAHKGIQVYKTHFQGKAAHSSCPHLGINAIFCAAQFMIQIGNLLPKTEQDIFAPPISTYNLGIIKGGSASNIIAEHCELKWEVRPLPNQNVADIENRFMEAMTALQEQNRGLVINHQVDSTVPGLAQAENVAIAQKLQMLMPESSMGTAPFVTEGGLFQQAGIPAVICGPGSITQAHQPNESVAITDMDRYQTFLAQALQSLSQK